MKKSVLLLLGLLVLVTACSGRAVESAQIPMVASMPKTKADPAKPTRSPLQDLDQPATTLTPYPEPAVSDEGPAQELPSRVLEPTVAPNAYPGTGVKVQDVPFEPTVTLDGYPAMVETGHPEQTAPPLISEETAVPIESKAGSSVVKSRVPDYSYNIINEYPHDRESHIQGLSVSDDPHILFEGSGLWGSSSLRRVDLETGEVIQFLPLDDQYFGEGITVIDDRIIQLTWKSGTGFVYDSESFDLIDEFSYAHEGWGITFDGQRLIVSDGTDTIHFWDPETLQETGQIHVFDEYGPVNLLNELEYIDGEIFANVWQTDTIVRIDPDSGKVVGRIDFTGLLGQEDRLGTEGVLNGIAYDSESGRLFVTGKRWPTLYEVELVPADIQE